MVNTARVKPIFIDQIGEIREGPFIAFYHVAERRGVKSDFGRPPPAADRKFHPLNIGILYV